MGASDTLEVFLEVPGVPRDAIKLNVQDGYLVIDGQKETDKEMEKSNNVRLTERDFGRFRRTLRLLSYVKTDDIEAKTGISIL